MVLVDEVATARVHKNRIEILSICEDEGKVLPTTVVEVSELFRDYVGTKRENAKLDDRDSDLDRECDSVQPVEQLAFVNVDVASAHIKTSEAKNEGNNEKYEIIVDCTAHVDKKVCSHLFSKKSSPKAEMGRVEKAARDKTEIADRSRSFTIARRRLPKRGEALRNGREDLTAVLSD